MEKSNYHLLPVLRHLRPCGADFATIPFATLRYSRDDRIGDLLCNVLEAVQDDRTSLFLWVAPERDHSILRHQVCSRKDGAAYLTCDVEVQKVRDEWLPKAWRTTVYHPSGELQEGIVVSDAVADINPIVPDGEFTYSFPAGTHVTKYSSTGHVAWIVNRDGTQRAVTVAEERAGATYQELVNTRSGYAIFGRRRNGMPTVLVVCIGAVLLFSGYLYYRARACGNGR